MNKWLGVKAYLNGQAQTTKSNKTEEFTLRKQIVLEMMQVLDMQWKLN